MIGSDAESQELSRSPILGDHEFSSAVRAADDLGQAVLRFQIVGDDFPALAILNYH